MSYKINVDVIRNAEERETEKKIINIFKDSFNPFMDGCTWSSHVMNAWIDKAKKKKGKLQRYILIQTFSLSHEKNIGGK